MATGTHEYVDDSRNAEILININGEFSPAVKQRFQCSTAGLFWGMAYGRAFDYIMVDLHL